MNLVIFSYSFITVGVCTVQWYSGYHAGPPIERFGIEIPARAEIWIEISAPHASLANSAMMSSIEYTNRTPSVGRRHGEGEN